MKFSVFNLVVLTLLISSCGGRTFPENSAALATNQHPLIGNWKNAAEAVGLTINQNGTVLSAECDLQATIGDIDLQTQVECGNNSKSCGTFPFIVAFALNHPHCMESGTYICFYNVYRVGSKDNLVMNCSDGRGAFYYQRQ